MGNILVTGAKGFIGSNVYHYLKERCSDAVIPLYREEVDLTDTFKVNKFFSHNNITHIVHCASKLGFRESEDSIEVVHDNLKMYENLTRQNVDMLINLGSGAEYDHRFDISNMDERSQGRVPSNFYGFSKFVIGQRVEAESKQANLRLFGVFGPGEAEDRFITRSMYRSMEGKPIEIHTDIQMDFVYIEDVCAIILNFLHTGPVRYATTNVCYDWKYSLSDIARIIDNITGNKYNPTIKYPSLITKNYTGCADRLTGYRLPLIGLEKGIQKYHESISNGW